MRSASVSMWPNIMVQVERPPSWCQTRWTSSHSSVRHLLTVNGLAHAIDEDLAAAAGQAAHAGVLEPLQHLAQRQLVELVEVPDFRRAEGVQVDRRDSAPSDRAADPRTIPA